MKTKKESTFKLLSIIFFSLLIGITSCDNFDAAEGDGRISLHITDAPIDEEGVTGVYITFTGIDYQIKGGAWQIFEEFEGPRTINLLELQNGKTELLGDFSGGAGDYTGLRFHLEAESKGSSSSTSGCYITFEDGTKEPLFVPSGDQTGYKAIANFSVPVNGTIEVTADFDLRKSVSKAGATGMYILQPTIRTIVNNEAGEIKGNITNTDTDNGYVVYAYEEGTYSEEDSESDKFLGAVTSTKAKESGDYVVAFLAAKTYDLILVEVDADGNTTTLSIEHGIEVRSRESVVVDFEM
jgi:hypothetical protein